ncbi:MAG: hypothetical protein ACRDFS_10145 [Chloroflexota bacterium]
MRTIRAAMALGFLAMVTTGTSWAATGKPNLAITSLSTRRAAVTVTVRVHHFTLSPPVLRNPPVLPPDHGHITYVLDHHFNPAADSSDRLRHTFRNLGPGRHSVTVYLATSQWALYPGTRRISRFVVIRKARHLHSGPVSGGGDGPVGTPDFLVFGFLVILMGLGSLALQVSLARVRVE